MQEVWHQDSLQVQHKTLRECFTRVKDKLQDLSHSCVVYRIPCSCGKFYIGETVRRLEMRLKEHRGACEKGMTKKSATAEHAWNENHLIVWEGVTIVDQAKKKEL